MLQFQNVTFRHEQSSQTLLEDVTLQCPPGWTGVVGPNGAGKTTLLLLACGQLSPTQGQVRGSGRALYCPQRTDDPPELFGEFLDDTDGEVCALRGRLQIDPDGGARWETLSHGERKRVQIGVALWQAPAILLLDEPTNHIDAQARALLQGALEAYRGIGLLVSHDRELLDALCSRCLFLEPPSVRLRQGNYTQAAELEKLDGVRAQRQRELAKEQVARLQRSAAQRQREASQADRKRSKRDLDLRDHDGRSKIDQARLAGADGHAGKIAGQMQGRLRHAQEALDAARVRKAYRSGIWIPGERSHRDTLIHLGPGSLPLGEGRRLRHPELSIRPTDRVAVTGPNGSGKSTLVRHLMARQSLPTERVCWIPQEVPLQTSREILDEARGASEADRGRLFTVVSRLGSRPDRLLESMEPSPGETRKLLLAQAVVRSPHLIAMDEPTNHMDLPSIECLEEALADCPCALLLVSHDLRFLRRVTEVWWRIEQIAGSADTIVRVAPFEGTPCSGDKRPAAA